MQIGQIARPRGYIPRGLLVRLLPLFCHGASLRHLRPALPIIWSEKGSSKLARPQPHCKTPFELFTKGFKSRAVKFSVPFLILQSATRTLPPPIPEQEATKLLPPATSVPLSLPIKGLRSRAVACGVPFAILQLAVKTPLPVTRIFEHVAAHGQMEHDSDCSSSHPKLDWCIHHHWQSEGESQHSHSDSSNPPSSFAACLTT